MELVAAMEHRALIYLKALQDQGYRPTTSELEAYAKSPDRVGGTYTNALTRMGARATVALLGGLLANTETSPPETFTSYFQRLGWAVLDADRVTLTGLGRALCGALELGDAEAEAVVVLAPDDPTALGRIVERIASEPEGLLVDPYFKMNELVLVAQHTKISRVLVSEKLKDSELQGLKVSLKGLGDDSPLEIRLGTGELHDRWFIPPAGPVTSIGSSVNSVRLGSKITTMARITDGAETIRELYEEMWLKAEPLLGPSTATELDS